MSVVIALKTLYEHDFHIFLAKMLEQLAGLANENFNAIQECLKALSEECKRISGHVNSEDSTLGAEWEQLGETIDKVEGSLAQGFESVSEELVDYSQRTIENEDALADFVKNLDKDLLSLVDSANNLIDGFDNLNEEIR